MNHLWLVGGFFDLKNIWYLFWVLKSFFWMNCSFCGMMLRYNMMNSSYIFFRIKNKKKSLAEDFAIWTIIWTLVAPMIHFLFIVFDINPNWMYWSIYAIAYSNADNWFGVLFCLYKNIKKYSYKLWFKKFLWDSFVFINFIVLIFLWSLDILVRSFGFYPENYFYVALEWFILNNDSTLSIFIFYLKKRFFL